jgi:hypothetical protein
MDPMAGRLERKSFPLHEKAKCGYPGTLLPGTLQGLHSELKVLDGQLYLVLNAHT